MTELKFHPAANAFPMMDGKRYSELLDDIRQHGQIETITLCDGMVLDGRNRYKACAELGITPKTRNYDGDPWSHAWRLNGQRRDLSDEQRYLIWKFCHEHSESFQAERQRIQDEANTARADAASKRERTETGTFEPVREHNVPILEQPRPGKQAKANSAKANRGAVARGDKLAKARPDLAAKVRLGEMKPAAAHRQLKKDELKEKASALPEGKYRVIYADPPWKYNDKCDSGGVQAAGAEKHYPAMSLDELEAMAIPDMAADDSVLFLWATCPLLEDALKLAKAWGFKYKAQFVWDKVKHNMGHYNSVRHELLLICTKGSCTPDNVKLFDSVQSIEKTEHSRKPEDFRTIIDTLYTVGKKIELFRRGETPEKWEAWGNELI